MVGLVSGQKSLSPILYFLLCANLRLEFYRLVEAVKAITGWEASIYQIVLGVERTDGMSRVFNNREK